jgi:hypothetical protein
MNQNSKQARKLRRVKNRARLERLHGQQRRSVMFLAPVFLLVFIKLALPYSNPSKLVDYLRLLVEKLTGNANFPTTSPTLAALTSKADALDATILAIVAGDKSLIPHRKTLVTEALEMIRLLSYDIQFQSDGDEEKIKSSGFGVRTIGGVSHTPDQVLVLVAKPVGPGKIKLRWKRVNEGRIYIIERLTGNNVPPLPAPGYWEAVGKTRNVSFTVEDLNPGQMYTFRVYASNGNQDGNPSDPAEQRSL